MDPITAISVGSAAISFLDFITTLFKSVYNIHKSSTGQKDTVAALSGISARLAQSNIELDEELSRFQDGNLSKCDQILKSRSEDCRELILEIQTLLNGLTVRGITHWDRTKSAFSVAFKSLWDEKKVSELKTRTMEIRAEIMFALLVSMRYVGALNVRTETRSG